MLHNRTIISIYIHRKKNQFPIFVQECENGWVEHELPANDIKKKCLSKDVTHSIKWYKKLSIRNLKQIKRKPV